jgi:hypothetical protein
MTILPDLDDFHDAARRLAVLILGRRDEPTAAEVLTIAQALSGCWRDGWCAHAASLPRRHFR